MLRRATIRRDENEPGIVEALLAAGAAVQQLDGDGIPDLLVSFRDVLYLLEVKVPLGPRGGFTRHRAWQGGRGDMTAAQVKWWEAWKGKSPAIVRSPEEALRAIGAIT